MESVIYLDNSATTRLSSHLIAQIQPFFKRHWQCPSSPHLKGKEPFTSIRKSVESIYQEIGAKKEDQFVFVSCAAEAISQVFHGVYFDAICESGKNHILTTPIEDASILMAIKRFEGVGCVKKMVELNAKGEIDCNALKKRCFSRTSIFSISWANGLLGIIHPIEEIAKICKEKEILLHVDCSDVLGKLYFQFRDLPIDFLTFDGDRLHAPKGSGGLFIRSNKKVAPLIPDGIQQNGLRGGTMNLPALIGLGIAFEEIKESFDHMCLEIARLRNKLEEGIINGLPKAKIFFRSSHRLPNTSVITFPGVFHELLAYQLSEQNIWASFGGGKAQKLEHLLTAVGIDPLEAKCSLSFSLSRDTTEEEINRAIGIIVDTVEKCQRLSNQIIK